MDRLMAMQVFLRVVEAGNFTRAAESMNLPKTAVTRLIQSLEAHLRTRLLNRTTRRVTVTPDGAAYYERASRLLADLDELDGSLSQARATPKGRLRVDVGASVGTLLILPRLPEFHAQYPDIQIDLGVSDRPVDLLSDNVDCVVRGGQLLDQSLVARRVGALDFITCASPGYLARHGTPGHPRDLERAPHAIVGYFSARTNRQMPFDYNRGEERHEITGRYVVAVNDSNAYLAGALAGLGVIQAPTFLVEEALATGELVRILEDWQSDPIPMYVVYPPNRHLSAKLRVFVDWIVDLFATGGFARPPAGAESRRAAIAGSVTALPATAVRGEAA